MIDDYIEGAKLLNNAILRLKHRDVYDLVKKAKRLVFVGNGGSMSCCGHMAHDFLKVGKKPTLSPESASLLTCLANDYGSTDMFAEWFSIQHKPGDLLIIVSSSGMSQNLISLAQKANMLNCSIVTITGFSPHNRLSQMGHINVHIPTQSFGIHELISECFLHSILDDWVVEQNG